MVQTMLPSANKQRKRAGNAAGMTLLELIIACAILMIIGGAAMPLARYSILRRKEVLLRYDLLEMRTAIDRYKEDADKNKVKAEIGSEGYPQDLDTLVKGVPLSGNTDKKIRFLREIPADPMTGRKDWVLLAIQDDPDATKWGGKNVFDVHSSSQDTALDGTKYNTW
jgi:general secretion pathway protein G